MTRVGLFLLTNLAVLGVASLTLNLLGVGSYLDSTGTGLDLSNLLVFCAVFGFGGAFVSLLLSKWMAKRMTGAEIIAEARSEQERWLLDTVGGLAERAGIGMPEVAVFPSTSPNAFATGWNRNRALVAVSAGLLHEFPRNEVRAVLGHEVGHVANGDMVTLALIQGVINTFVMFFARIIGHFVDRVILRNEHGHGIGFYVATFITEIILAVLASMLVAWFSRRREFRADVAGAELADRDAMISALQRLGGHARQADLGDQLTAFGISGSLRAGLSRWFATHPPIDARIDALRAGAASA